ncbi:response regulator [Megasphaera sp. AM44-1BH]|uniref:response regulator transcription factor n=1 Tax=Megasphaera sp. AM44-1BH TaxID=2292358 RepID=UPI000E50A39C|nr:response regulator [Megasphaera sp. AM44-1BH]RHA14020.1 response regulator [Megasphaera sp. AM44-1BH]
MLHAIIVDDEPAVAAIIKHFIEKDCMPVTIDYIANNGKQALNYIRRHNPQLVFLDIQMPIMNGFEVMKEAPDTRYVIITAIESFSYAQQALRLGARDILLKPIDHKQLTQAIIRAVGWKFTDNGTINTLLEYINEHYAEKIELNKLSEIVYATPSHIARLFKKHMGMSIITYVHQVRIERAVQLLDSGTCSIKMAAEMTGYESLNNFYKYFKLHMHMTPSAYCSQIEKHKS